LALSRDLRLGVLVARDELTGALDQRDPDNPGKHRPHPRLADPEQTRHRRWDSPGRHRPPRSDRPRHSGLRRWKWKDVRRHLTGRNGRWTRPTADGIELFNMASVSVIDTDTAAARSPTPGQCSTTPEWQTPWRARCRETGTAGSASGLGKRTRSNPGTAPQADSTRAIGSSGKARFHAAWSACGFALSRRQRGFESRWGYGR
jgi:hypothetical protein